MLRDLVISHAGKLEQLLGRWVAIDFATWMGYHGEDG